jgi:hypothetical protein
MTRNSEAIDCLQGQLDEIEVHSLFAPHAIPCCDSSFCLDSANFQLYWPCLQALMAVFPEPGAVEFSRVERANLEMAKQACLARGQALYRCPCAAAVCFQQPRRRLRVEMVPSTPVWGIRQGSRSGTASQLRAGQCWSPNLAALCLLACYTQAQALAARAIGTHSFVCVCSCCWPLQPQRGARAKRHAEPAGLPTGRRPHAAALPVSQGLP